MTLYSTELLVQGVGNWDRSPKKVAERVGFRKISADLYTVYEDSLFGTEIFGQIDLCAMYEKKQDSGYYHYECSINICPASSEKQEDLQTDDLKENVIGASLNDGAFGHIGKTPLNQQSSSNE
ncbi:A-kinase anchor protein 7-like isoform X2 [Heteronotia binoei]|uniref:A-kinase anchor protein 7-like isoform X2 n=1 Tax=Heteronotia binoei TaxID=13085 RepID=UPI00292E2700|nr:A-kinase anchor protein 7-like isoform X2 [Heteronotia binoei]